jgi:cytochrome c oxidase cbb3-type subunit III
MIAALGGAFAISQLVAQPPAGAPAGPPGAPGGSGAAGRGGRGGGRAGGFPQYTRQLASQDVLVRGKSLYDSTCSSCHAPDLRGVLGKGANVLRSQPVYSDQHGELLTVEIGKHKPALTLVPADITAIAEYLHSVQATMGGQGSPPGRNPTDIQLTILVGNAGAGKTYFDGHCANCHSITSDLKGIGTKYADDPRGLQNTWVGGAAGAGRGGRGGGGGGQATVTLASGEKFQGRIVKQTDFLIVLNTADNVRHTWPIVNGSPKIDVVDPQAAHKKMALEMDDPDNKNMHDVTAYLATLK